MEHVASATYFDCTWSQRAGSMTANILSTRARSACPLPAHISRPRRTAPHDRRNELLIPPHHSLYMYYQCIRYVIAFQLHALNAFRTRYTFNSCSENSMIHDVLRFPSIVLHIVKQNINLIIALNMVRANWIEEH